MKTLIIGPNGSGKTTFCNKIYEYNPRNTLLLPSENENKATSIFRNFKIKDMVKYLDQNKRKRFKNLLVYFDAGNILERNFIELSGGEQKIITFSFQYIGKFQTMIIDEPEKDLSSKNAMRLLKLINKNHQDVYLVTHNSQIIKKFIYNEKLKFKNFQFKKEGGHDA